MSKQIIILAGIALTTAAICYTIFKGLPEPTQAQLIDDFSLKSYTPIHVNIDNDPELETFICDDNNHIFTGVNGKDTGSFLTLDKAIALMNGYIPGNYERACKTIAQHDSL